jgi:hypothetical protein
MVHAETSNFGCAECPHVVYAIGYEMVHFLTLCNLLER